VAWDSLEPEVDGFDQGVVALIEAHALAGRLGLRWSDPVERALAERAVARRGSEPWLRRVLAATDA
jgi:hypothetical protein